MRKLLLVFINSIRRLVAFNSAALGLGLLLVALCPVFTSVFSNANGIDAIHIGFNDADKTVASRAVERYCGEVLGMELEPSNNQDQLDSLLLDKKISAVVEVPAGFEAALLQAGLSSQTTLLPANPLSQAELLEANPLSKVDPLSLKLTFMQDYENQVFLSGYLTSYTNTMQQLASDAQGSPARFETLLNKAIAEATPVNIVSKDPQQIKQQMQFAVRSTILAFFLMFGFIIGIGFARLLAEDRKNNTYARVKITGVRPVSYIAGLCLAGTVSSLLLLLPVLVFWQAQGFGALLHVPELALLGMLYTLFVVGFSLVAGMFFNSSNAMIAALVAAATILNLLGGAFWPANMMPDFMQQIAHFTPSYWFMEAVNSLDTANPNAYQLWMDYVPEIAENTMLFSVIIIALFALLCYLVAGIRFALRENN